MKLSVVSTLYQSSLHLEEFFSKVSSAARDLVGEEFEIILVNDGSTDNSLEIAITLAGSDSHTVVVDLSRNFGHHKAVMCGLAQSKGELVFLVDSDLEENPAWLTTFHEQLNKEGCDVVYGVQERRRGNLFERWSGEFFYLIINLLSGISIQKNSVTARLMTRRYVDALLLHNEREVMLFGLLHITGFDQKAQYVNKLRSSETTYTFRKKFALVVNSISSFSSLPLTFIFSLGVLVSFFSSLYISYLAIHWLFLATPPSGWTSIMASIWLLGGFTISSLGLIGIYLSKVFLEIKGRPSTIIRHIYGKRNG